jgi:hypothetical protein
MSTASLSKVNPRAVATATVAATAVTYGEKKGASLLRLCVCTDIGLPITIPLTS